MAETWAIEVCLKPSSLGGPSEGGLFASAAAWLNAVSCAGDGVGLPAHRRVG